MYKGAGKGGPEPLGGRQSILIDYPPPFFSYYLRAMSACF